MFRLSVVARSWRYSTIWLLSVTIDALRSLRLLFALNILYVVEKTQIEDLTHI
jgi:hypothetical protein